MNCESIISAKQLHFIEMLQTQDSQANIIKPLVKTVNPAGLQLLTSFLSNFQKKVNPDLPVEIKPSNRARKLLEVKLRKQKQKSGMKRQHEDEQRWHIEMRSLSAFNLL